uniref:C2 domain-containing protein n=1 Tax=Xenopus tropicalis TaxID=8364 RepID=A0A803JZU6_XENTR
GQNSPIGFISWLNDSLFSVLVRTIEGRQLTGNNIKPVVKVKIGHQTQHTRIRSGNNPYFNQVQINQLLFSFQALRSRALRADSLIGEFKISELFYKPKCSFSDLEGHAIIRKWIALYDPKDSSLSPRGYLKVSLFILGKGDHENDWIIVLLKSVKGLFRSNVDKKNLADPFTEVAFAGDKVTNPREFSRYPDHYDELNRGLGEGIAYRGRILVNESLTNFYLAPITSYLFYIQKYQFKRKYSLCAVFYSATMLQDAVGAVQFEVSIGNYGNKFDCTCKALPSTTQYRQPQFDGNFYYYIPWSTSKPVVALTSHWEDISHRLDVVNILIALTDRLVSTRHSKVCCSSLAEVVTLWQNVLDQLIEDAGKHLPSMERRYNVNELDWHRRHLQQSALTHIKAAAAKMRRSAADVQSTLPSIEEWIDRLKQLSEEPQTSMPDIIIWMIKAERRVAYARIPAHLILFSKTGGEACGKFCGKIQTIFLKYPLDKGEGRRVPVQLRVNLWLGLSEAESEINQSVHGMFSVHAEMYENQSRISGRWSSRFLLNHPKFSDATGTIKLKKNSFVVPEGWDWEGDWQVDNERSLPNKDCNGHREMTEEVFVNERRLPNGKWKLAKEAFTDANGEKSSSPDKIGCPHGWIWDDDTWKCDVTRAVDENGWEYGTPSSPNNQPQHWVSSEKTYHTRRRRRLVRRRSKVSTPNEVIPSTTDKGWEYAAVSGWTFHTKRCGTDTFRRRRWIRNLVPSGQQGAPPIFNLEGNQVHVSVYKYHLRCYLYQARGLAPMDRDSFSDPYAHVSFLHKSLRTEIINSTLNPTWDQTLVFSDIEICGKPREIAQNPPNIVIEIYDNDSRVKDDFLGRSLFFPMVKLDPNVYDTPKLFWCPVTRGNRHCGDILVAAELFLQENDGCILPVLPSERVPNIYMVPEGIRPVLQLTGIEILTWGLRSMRHLESVRSATITVECGGQTVETAMTGILGMNPNFQTAVLFLKVYLPQEELYTPPIVIKVVANRLFGRKEVVGQCTIEQLEEFRCEPYPRNQDNPPDLRGMAINVLCTPLFCKEEDDEVDWWAKYFASKGEHEMSALYTQRKYNTLKVYGCELERVPEFLGLTDFCQTFKLYTGKAKHDEEPAVAGEFKGSFCIYQVPEDPSAPQPPQHFRELPDSGSQECIVRVYIVRGIDLQPKDNNGLCDPYIKLSLNDKVVVDRENYIPNTLNPLFGRMYELSCILPQEKDLKISIYDYDALSGDDKVGETTIDLENRLLSRFRGHCGLPETYCVSGVNQWRDQLKPTEILQNLARCRAVPPPVYKDDGRTVIFSGLQYTVKSTEKDHEFLGPMRERVALQALHDQGLVPEHVETRTLYSSCQPNIPQGKVEMWVDIFPTSLGLPGPAVNIAPRKPKRFVLRTIVWNTKDVILDDENVLGEKMSDIYVKGWLLGNEDDKQRTDVHFRSLDGEGNFNWRFVFPFDYLPAEQQCIISKKDHVWSLDATEQKLPPKLIIQIWDNDKFSRDDYIGFVELDLNNVIMPATEAKKCSLKLMDRPKETVSLFKKKSMRGWWPCYAEKEDEYVLTGKVELTLEILTEEEAEERPAGKGRDPPNTNPTLSEPIRPETSFLWFTSIFKAFQVLAWPRLNKLYEDNIGSIRRGCIIAAVVVFVMFCIFFFIMYILVSSFLMFLFNILGCNI